MSATDADFPFRSGGVRPPAGAGYFYPAEPAALERELRRCYVHPLGPGVTPGEAPEGRGSSPIAVVAPHAGLRYSGPFAANAYHRLGVVRAAIVLGPNHRGRGSPLAVAPPTCWRTPLGDVESDPDLVEALRSRCADLQVDARAHAAEHSVELQAIFLRYVLGPAARMVAVSVWGMAPSEVRRLGEALAAVQAERPALLVASTDLSHYLPDDLTRRRDALAIEAIERLDVEKLTRLMAADEATLCGGGAALAVLYAARELGASGAQLLRYGTSADTGGGRDVVVGYAALRVDRPTL